ncbi:DEAD/DEAH box helicase family protein (plasmid) [Lichenicola cladoniae]|uniref:DEAD/DEAH box helicase family protein n=1 Tax=Lichenicola cladoniae TaxID=1484109 RepID=A0A6M8HXB3_9PROT|nr:DEAD/DEAH box helicase family protein [Lichenicola cladoniae]NPD68201.1 DEAD/DEAH box helicase family protein [Acetobacteraceae bacterium]QKE92980.1 DEAD/DEAH box helicase family protein [Lichenicola cladoniae]
MTSSRPLRTHQQRLANLVAAMAAGETTARDILAAVTPGGGKSLLPVIAAARLIEAGLIERVCWIVPRDSLRLQAEEAFTDPVWRSVLGHRLSVRAADNTADPSRGLAGYITTYQGVAAAPDLHLREMRRYRTLLVVDEVHHLPALADTDPDAAARAAGTDEEQASAWSQAILPLLECATVRLLLSGTLERADGKAILWLPYRKGVKARTREIELDAPGWAVIGYSRAQALLERAVLPVTFGALDGEARWRDEDDTEIGPHRLANLHPDETTRPALFTALRTGFAETLLHEAFIAIRDVRARRRQERDLQPGAAARGLGKLLVVAPDQAMAKHYLGVIRRWIPAAQAEETAQLATSDTPRAHQILASFRLRPEPSILVTVAMAYEGLDAPDVAVVAALTHIRSRAWLEQMVARATRVDPHAGPYETQQALVFHPDDPLFALFRRRMEYEQGTLARPKAKRKQSALPLWLLDQLPPAREGITPLDSNALALRFDTLRPGPELALKRPEQEAAQAELLEAPSVAERRLRARLGEMVAAQAVEDEAGRAGFKGGTAGPGLYHRYNAVLKRMTGNKNRAQMTLAELEAAIGWLERNQLQEHLHLLDDDPRYAWTARQRGEWRPPVGRLTRTTTDAKRAPSAYAATKRSG